MLAGIILAKNEEKNIEQCLKSLKFCDQIVVVDTGSTDETLALAKRHKAKILMFSFSEDFSKVRNWALEEVKSTWVLFVDADEAVSPELAQEITKAIAKIDYKGYTLHRVDYLWGHKLKHGDVGGVKLVRLARRGSGVWEGKVHETWAVEGNIGHLKSPLLHYPHQTVAEFLQKINYYSSIRAREFYKQGKQTNILEITLGPVWRFLMNYVFKFGFLDGTAGFVHAMIMAFYMFMVSGKLFLLYKRIGDEA